MTDEKAFLQARGLGKSFSGESVLRSVTFDLEPRQVLSVVGRSGCGKTTLLKIIAGLLPADEGTIERRGRDITVLKAEQRDIVYLYQEAFTFNAFGGASATGRIMVLISLLLGAAYMVALRRQSLGHAR